MSKPEKRYCLNVKKYSRSPRSARATSLQKRVKWHLFGDSFGGMSEPGNSEIIIITIIYNLCSIPLIPPSHNPTQSQEVQNPLEIAGFFHASNSEL